MHCRVPRSCAAQIITGSTVACVATCALTRKRACPSAVGAQTRVRVSERSHRYAAARTASGTGPTAPPLLAHRTSRIGPQYLLHTQRHLAGDGNAPNRDRERSLPAPSSSHTLRPASVRTHGAPRARRAAEIHLHPDVRPPWTCHLSLRPHNARRAAPQRHPERTNAKASAHPLAIGHAPPCRPHSEGGERRTSPRPAKGVPP